MEDIKDTQVEEAETQVIDDKKDENINNVEDKKKDEKLFTQDEVNKIVQDRVQREKARTQKLVNGDEFSLELLEREKNIELREMKADAKESLNDLNIPNDLNFMELINFSDRKAMEKSLRVIEEIYSKFETTIEERVRIEIKDRLRGHAPPASSNGFFVDRTADAFKHPNLR